MLNDSKQTVTITYCLSPEVCNPTPTPLYYLDDGIILHVDGLKSSMGVLTRILV